MEKDSKIYVAGHRGLVGSAVLRELKERGYLRLVTRTHEELDLTRQAEVEDFFSEERPDYVFLAAARVGGILANSTYPADFIRENLQIQTHAIHAAYQTGVKKLLFLGSSCIYPRDCPQPMKEEYLLSGKLEPTNEPYAVAKIAGITMCQGYNRQHGTRFVSVMPTNLYGPEDNFDLENSHVLAALVRKFCDARAAGEKTVTVWGTGRPRREFLHVDDMADACLFIMNRYEGDEIINIGTGRDVTIQDLALLIRDAAGFTGEIRFDPSKPDGTPQKLLDVSRLTSLGWKSRIPLRDGIERTCRWYLENARQG